MNEKIKQLTLISTRCPDSCKKLFEERNLLLTYYNADDIKSLTAFVTRGKTIQDMDYFIIDLTDTLYSNEHVLYAIQIFRQVSQARVIIIAPTGEETDLLFGKLLNFNIKNLIAADDDKKILEELIICLSPDGKSFAKSSAMKQNAMAAKAKTITKPQITIPRDCQISVAVTGAMHRVGVTTQALNIYHYAMHLGFSPFIVDREQKMIKSFMQIYEEEVILSKTHMELKGICFAQDKVINNKFNFFIYDLGVLCDGNENEFISSDIPVFVTGAKPWELPPLGELFNRYGFWEKEIITKLFSFASDKDFEILNGYFKDKIYAVPYTPDIWNDCDVSFYNKVLLGKLKELCNHA